MAITNIPARTLLGHANTDGDGDLIRMLAMRLRWSDGQPLPYMHLYVTRVDNEVIVVVVNTGQAPVVMQDGWDLFPSDTLITQLRLLEP